jgi:soluble lytic murein transglycosylase-like protein
MRHTLLPVFVVMMTSAIAPTVANADCIDDAAAWRHISPKLVRAIAQQESGMRTGAIDVNANGTEDIGLMQINSSWLPSLARFGIRREQLFDGCVNAYVGTWILASNFRHFGQTWKAVGAYNASSNARQLLYANSIYRRLQGH